VTTVLGVLAMVGTISSSFWRLRTCPQLPRRLWQTVFHKGEYAPEADVQFRWIMAGSGKGPDESRFDTNLYESSDCVRVYSTLYSFPSAPRAQSEIQRRLKSDFRTLSHTYGAESGGDVNLERALTQIARNGEFFVMQRNGSKILMVGSASLTHALAFESRLRFGTEARLQLTTKE
jgi:hypothetical protein